MDLYHREFFIYYLRALVVIFSISSLFFVKILFSRKALSPKPVDLFSRKALISLFVISFVFFYMLFLRGNYTLSTSTFMGHLVYNLSKFNFYSSYNETSLLSHIFYSHIMLGAFLLVPFFKLISRHETILFIQSALIAFGVFPVFWLGERLLKDRRFALAFSLMYLLHPSLHFSAIWGLSLPLFATPFIILALYFLFSNQPIKFLISLVLFISWKESFAVPVALLGLYIFIFMRKRKLGIVTMLLGMVWFFGSLKIMSQLDKVTPLARGEYYFEGYKNLVFSLVQEPRQLFNFLFDPKIFAICLMMLIPTGLLALLSPFILLIPYANLLMACLFPSFRNIWYPYFVSEVPFVIVAAMFASRKIISFFERKDRFKNNISAALLLYIICASILSFIIINPYVYTLKIVNPHKFSRDRHQERFLTLAEDYGIPRDSSVAVNWDIDSAPAAIAMRKEIYWFPMPEFLKKNIPRMGMPRYKDIDMRDADYIIIDTLLPYRDSEAAWTKIQDLLWHNTGYGVEGYDNGFLVIKKEGKKNLLDIIKVDTAMPQHRANIALDSAIELVGYDIEDEYVRRGSRFKITYYWKALRDIDREYRIATIFKKPNVEEFYWIHTPVDGLYPTSRWKKGVIIKDEVFVRIPTDLKIVKAPFVISIGIVYPSGDGDKDAFGDIFILPDFY